MTEQTRFELLVGLHITDDESYDKYRDGTTQLLKEHGGYFRYDYTITEMLQGGAEHPHNRVFVLSFPDESTKNRFFANETYQEVRARYFDPAVQSVTQIAAFTRQP